MATMKELLSLMIERINGKPGNWEELTGKPFGLTMGWEILVEQPDIIGSGYSQEPYSAFVALTDVALEQGKIYKVAINGDEWEVKAFVLPEDTNVYLGDASDRLEEMPFHIYSTEDKTLCIIWQITPEEYEMGAPMANITISKGYEAVDTLGYEFMPLDYPAVLKEYVEIMPKAVIKFEETGLNGSVYSNSTIINEGLLSEDKAYRITFNGERYICQAQVWRGSTFLGNLEILTGTDGNDLPFAILGNMLNWKVELGEEVNLQIEEINNIIRPIDKKFIPDGVGGGVRSVNNTMPDENGNVEILLPEIPELTWDNIEDKPFGTKTEIEYTEVFSCENRRVGTIYDIPQNTYGLALSHQLIVGKEYKVELNGVVAYDTAKVEDDIVYIGNWDTAGLVSSDMPFYIYNAAEDSICVGYSKELGDRLNMKLYIGQRKEIVQPLDYKYMPDGYPKIETEMIEIVPEQSVTNESIAGTVCSNNSNEYVKAFKPVPNVQYEIVINGEKYSSTGTKSEYDEGAYQYSIMYSAGEIFFSASYIEGENAGFNWSKSLGETITLSIYEEQEVVKPIDPKFLPENIGGGASILPEAGASQYLTTDELGQSKWEEKPFYKSDLIVAEAEGSQDYFTEIGNEIAKFYEDTSVNWNFTFDGAPWSTPRRRLPINIGSPVEGVVDLLHIYQENGNVIVDIIFTNGGKHIVTFERLAPKYKTIDECFLPDTVATKTWVEELIGGIENGTY